jgi:hypothetical protein
MRKHKKSERKVQVNQIQAIEKRVTTQHFEYKRQLVVWASITSVHIRMRFVISGSIAIAALPLTNTGSS